MILFMFHVAPSPDSHGAYGGSDGNRGDMSSFYACFNTYVIVLYFHKRIIYPCFAWILDIQTKLATNLYVTQIKSFNREALALTVFLSTYVAYGGSGDDSVAGGQQFTG